MTHFRSCTEFYNHCFDLLIAQAWQSALAQHEGEDRIASRATPRVGREALGTGWQQLKIQVNLLRPIWAAGFRESSNCYCSANLSCWISNLNFGPQYAVPWPLHLVVTAQVTIWRL